MSDSEKDKDVTCFTADGIVAEMVIEVEENQKLGSDDLPSSPAKDNHYDKENESKEFDDTIEERTEESQLIESDSEKENRENSVESIVADDKNEKHTEDKRSEEINCNIVEDTNKSEEENAEYFMEEQAEVQNDPIVEDKTCDEVIQDTEDKSDEINDQVVDNKSTEIKEKVDNKLSEVRGKADNANEIKEKVDKKSSEIKEKVDKKSSEIKEKDDKKPSKIKDNDKKPSKIKDDDKKPSKIKDDDKKPSKIKDDKKPSEIKDDKKPSQIKAKYDKKPNQIKRKVENQSSRIKQKYIKNSQNLKKKRQRESIMDERENDKESGMPRYPGRKRIANKLFFSEDMITPKRKISESVVDFKDSPKEAKRRKVEVDSKEKEEKKNISKDAVTKKSIEKESEESSKESDKTNLGRSLRNRKSDMDSEKTPSKQNAKSDMESEKSATKQSVLRKLPFRKNKDAPDVPELKPNVFWWNGVGDGQGCKLGDIPEIRGRIQKAKSIRALYRVLFFQWPANGQDVVGEILKFNGFPFDKSSYEYSKRQSLMKIMLDKTIFHMCELLDIRKGDKQSCIKNILEFLLNPSSKVDPATDPRWQPVVVLERMKIDDTFLHQSTNAKQRKNVNSFKKDVISNFSTPRLTRSTRPIEIELVITPGDDPEESQEDVKPKKAKLSTSIESNRLSKRSLLKSNVKENVSTIKDSKLNSSRSLKKTPSTIKDSKMDSPSGKRSLLKSTVKENISTTKESKLSGTSNSKKVTPASVTDKVKSSVALKDEKNKTTSAVKGSKEKFTPVKKDVKSSPKALKSKPEEIKNNVSTKLERRKKFNKRRKKIITTSSKTEPVEKKEELCTQSNDDSDGYDIEMTVDSGPDIDEDIEMKDTDEKNPDSMKTPVEQKTKTQTVKTPEVTLKTTVSSFTLSDSSETESAEETKLVTAAKKTSKVPMKRKGKPLRHFPKVSDSIQNANFSALQRLHILLFGASDKAENLKSNILSFGGFPFLEGSDEWKQKHFLLSLLAQNNLREYLNLLCIPYAHDDQPAMINKLMKFLAVPSEELLANTNTIHPIETEVVSSVLVDKSSPVAPPPKGKTEIKKKVKKKDEKKGPKRKRKVLMSEEEARRLEANFAREQRALARERKHIMKTYVPIAPLPQTATPSLNMHTYVPQPKLSAKQPPISDPEQLNALLQTVYKRRALKAAGAVVSTPNKGQKTKLGEIENVKFLIVTSNISDLEILHRLIFMLEASKSRIRKNILDFDGFGFNEDSPKYKHRMDYLNSLGYEASKRISFLLGLCPLNTTLPQIDLNELIMYFLMSPCKSKQTVPITQMPTAEPHIIVKSTAPLANAMYSIQNVNVPLTPPTSSSAKSKISKTSSNETVIQHSTPLPKTGTQKAKKTFPSSSKISPIKKVLLPPTQAPVLGVASLGNKPQKLSLLNSVPAVPAYSLPKTTVSNSLSNVALLNTGGLILNAPKTVNPLAQVPPGTKIQILNQSPKVSVIDPKIPVSLPNVPGQVLQNQILIPQASDKNNLQPSQITPLLSTGSKMLVKSTAGVAAAPEFIVQQQTPDGQQKVFKLIRLPPTHPLVSNAAVNKPPVQQTVSSPQIPQQLLLTTNAPLPGNLPPGIIIMKNNTGMPPMHILPSAPTKMLPLSSVSSPASSQPKSSQPQSENVITPDKSESASADTSLDNSLEVSSEDSPPTDEDLFSSIQEVILSSNFEDITLRNVIDRVAAQYKNHDLTHRYNYMKECVKKIIMGTG